MNKQLKKSLNLVNLHQKSAPNAVKRAKISQSHKSHKLNRGLESNKKVDPNIQTNTGYWEREAENSIDNEVINADRHSTTAIHRLVDQDASFLYQLTLDEALDPAFSRLKDMLDAGLNISQCLTDPFINFQGDRFYALISHTNGRALGEFLLTYHEKNLNELNFFKTNMEKMPKLMVFENSLKRSKLFEMIISKGTFSNEDILDNVSVYDNYRYFLEKIDAMIEKCMLTRDVPLTEITIKPLKI